MIIRKPKEEEFGEYLRLDKEFYNSHKNYGTLLYYTFPKKRDLKKDFNDLLKKNNFFRFAVEDDKVIGYIYGFIKKVDKNKKGWEKIGDLNSIIISKKYRKKGVANKLVKEFIKWLKSKNISYVEASCNVKNNSIIKFNKKLGLKEQHIKFGKLI